MFDVRDFGRRLFLKNYWGIDFLAGMIFSVMFGRFIQIAADSGEKDIGKIASSILIAGFSYSVFYLVSLFTKLKQSRYPSWLFIGVGGSIFYAFNRMIVYFLIVNWDSPGHSANLFEYLVRLLPLVLNNFVWASILFSFLVLAFIFTFRFVAVSIKSFNEREGNFQ